MMTTVKINPGPGAYENKPALNDKGSYFVSKFQNSMATTINPSRSVRFLQLKNSPQQLNPGPDRYSPQGHMSKDGAYFVSKFHSSMCRTHYHADRKTLLGQSLATPGPGQYRLPSDFGYYESKNISDQRMRSSQSVRVLKHNEGTRESL
mmetsp:Transcript_35612/g.34646  ORF Transcript_35612/g.34646 Transcript_35612/m.34646 type:complete len:149 (+) Transcript_35612:450-896(+)